MSKNAFSSSVIALCRAGFERDCAAELAALSAEQNCYGFAKHLPSQGWVEFQFYTETDASKFVQQNPVAQLIFVRQMMLLIATIEPLPEKDRVGSVLNALDEHHDSIAAVLGKTLSALKVGGISVDYPDTEEGKSVAKFAKKFVVPMRQALRSEQLLSRKENLLAPQLHVLLPHFQQCLIGVTFATGRSDYHNGIHRLKFPPDAPSRSTLKLDEAILDLLTSEQRASLFREGARAVDLGACPGGWTYQLVIRGMSVEAVDNGAMAESLMRTGLVSYAAADGFKYRPEFGSVELVVCDMIERPDRVATLITDWLINGWARAAIFNLKLPMKQRYETTAELLTQLKQRLANESNTAWVVRCKQLYHDRDEVTVSIIPR
ncbi:23S rRNA (cytidine(2498)-2'-O)-methyltransferase RlmM [Alteromonas oceanisediminis]|uniref:23S rRNA (cytidine(2498)-2'-O)-methyltransferase RlmM n=1 Tax=Alteromonas oceanisediminis TaxID=2836180 RepID=UPI001BDA043B|nr:23S rRNA (cytidine(2498)-2'-O)-methyltransferase RlmM [Alteromonas oceanisediminis]MBT0587314.1 23S rRNA (cytidine(2498)-2'-O)-methyltransferase RlmM [Alteromonas oceanisediminis]